MDTAHRLDLEPKWAAAGHKHISTSTTVADAVCKAESSVIEGTGNAATPIKPMPAIPMNILPIDPQ